MLLFLLLRHQHPVPLFGTNNIEKFCWCPLYSSILWTWSKKFDNASPPILVYTGLGRNMPHPNFLILYLVFTIWIFYYGIWTWKILNFPTLHTLDLVEDFDYATPPTVVHVEINPPQHFKFTMVCRLDKFCSIVAYSRLCLKFWWCHYPYSSVCRNISFRSFLVLLWYMDLEKFYWCSLYSSIHTLLVL